MEALRQRRTHLRSSFTRAANQLEAEVKGTSLNKDAIAELWEQLQDKGKKLADVETQIETLMQVNKCTQEEFNAQCEAAEAYSDRLASCRAKVSRVLYGSQGEHNNGATTTRANSASNRKFRLPELEFKKFDGNLKDWLSFWGQFKKVDNDPEIGEEDKFQYLVQATAENSRARELVLSFPPTTNSYSKAIKCLKSRFGNEDMLVEVYVRELLRLVLCNAVNPKQKVSVSILYDKLETQLRALETLGVAADKYASMLYPLVESCLPADVLKAWERSRHVNVSDVSDDKQGADDKPGAEQQPTKVSNRLSLLMRFLRSEVEGEERINMARTGFGLNPESKKNNASKNTDERGDIPTAAGLFSGNQGSSKGKEESSCIFCSKQHLSAECRGAGVMTFEEKKRVVAEKGACFVCLRAGHIARRCKSKIRCPICEKRHPAILCPDKPSNRAAKETPVPAPSQDSVLSNGNCSSEVLLQTLVVRLRTKDNSKVGPAVRLLIDSGSQRSYISEAMAREMGYERIGQAEIVHHLFGGVETTRQLHQKYRVHLISLDGSYACNFEVLDQHVICGNIPRLTRGPWTVELHKQGIVLSDAYEYTQAATDIHVLVGADVAGKLMTGRVLPCQSGPVAIETRLGWTVMGKIPVTSGEQNSALSVSSLYVRDASISDLWQLDRLGITDPIEHKTKEEQNAQVMQAFCENIKADATGRYEVSLPWTECHPQLPSNRTLAEKRLKSMCNKLQKDGRLTDYQQVLKEWLEEGVIEKVPLEEHHTPGHYLPHRAVVREERETTKIRPVFDASAKEKGQPCLNDCLETGPNLVELIPSVLNRFRLKRIGVISDIRKAFLQISLCERDRDYVRFLWWEDGKEDQLQIFRHRRVVFGVTSSPFLLGATLTYHLDSAPGDLRETADLVKDSLYVDNLVTSVNNDCELRQLMIQSQELFSSAKFELHAWKHSSSDIHTGVEPRVIDAVPTGTQKFSALVPVLGLSWDLHNDTLSCDVRDVAQNLDARVTKRIVLSVAHRVFDPVGFTCPVTLLPKLLLQECWQMKMTWDGDVPECLEKRFKDWLGELPLLQEVRVPRWILGETCPRENLSIHVFCDACQKAYAACVFIRAETTRGVNVQLIQARSRVSPLKSVTIPRLELLACCIGARLADSVKKDLSFHDVTTFYWSDSSNALCWIKRTNQWGVFVNNRVQEILSLSKRDDWHHVPGIMNPADLPSRGCTPSQLLKIRWWEGPQWLQLPREEWPQSELTCDESVISAECRKPTVSVLNRELPAPWYCQRFSSYPKIVRLVAWIWRFCHNCKKPQAEREVGELSASETGKAELSLMRLVQGESFVGPKDGRLRTIQIFSDPEGVMRVKTQLLMRDEPEHFKFPIILPSNHPLVEFLISWTHRTLNHAGVQITMSQLRERYWIIRSRRTIKGVLRKCVRCQRYSAKRTETAPAPLPKDRVCDAAVFQIVGVDLAGPLFIKGGSKVWIVLYTCAVYRAVHLELVNSLSTEAFLQSLRRFVARRGRPSVIYSDNGTNFVGANNAFKGIDWQAVSMQASVKRIEWRFNPPTAAWWGGWWERLVGLLKSLLRRVLGRASLFYEELLTVLCECEGILNSRPLTYVSEECEDLTPLTPAAFIQDLRNSDVTDIDLLDSAGVNKRAKYRQRLKQALKKRFRTEYLGQLRQQYRITGRKYHLSVGDVVLLESDQSKRIDWPLARIMRLFPGKDGEPRVAEVKTKTGIVTRPVQRIYPLEIKSDQQLDSGTRLKAKIECKKRVIPRSTVLPTPPTPVTTRSGRTIKKPDRLSYVQNNNSLH